MSRSMKNNHFPFRTTSNYIHARFVAMFDEQNLHHSHRPTRYCRYRSNNHIGTDQKETHSSHWCPIRSKKMVRYLENKSIFSKNRIGFTFEGEEIIDLASLWMSVIRVQAVIVDWIERLQKMKEPRISLLVIQESDQIDGIQSMGNIDEAKIVPVVC